MNRLALFIPLALFISFAIIVWQVKGSDPEAVPSALLGRAVPAFSMPMVKDAETLVSEKDLKIDGYALVNMWATWCGPCRIEHPYLVSLAESGVRIYGVNGKDDLDAARMWLAEKGDPYKFSVFDIEGRLGLDMGITGYPETFLIGKHGKILHRRVGIMDGRIWTRDFLPIIEQL